MLLAVCDSNYNFIYIDVGSFGRECDSTILSKSSFGRKLNEGSLNLPPPEKLAEDIIPLPYTFVGDEAFGLSTNLMRAFPSANLNVKKRVFNYRLCRARRYVECSFGILSNKWRVFHRPLQLKTDVAVTVVKACCALHNFVRARDGVRFEETLDITGLHDIEYENNNETPRGAKRAYKYRDAFANYFISNAGSLPWQYRNI